MFVDQLPFYEAEVLAGPPRLASKNCPDFSIEAITNHPGVDGSIRFREIARVERVSITLPVLWYRLASFDKCLEYLREASITLVLILSVHCLVLSWS